MAAVQFLRVFREPQNDSMNRTRLHNRRSFLCQALMAGICSAFTRTWSTESVRKPLPPVALFDKVTHQAGLSLEETAELVAASGVDGVDCAVRPRDRIEPERVREDLPRYEALLRARGKRVWLLTTAILGVETPHARTILETARAVGIRHYRLGFLRKASDRAVADQIRELRQQLRELVAWNRELGLCALLQNHSPSGPSQYLGGDLREMADLLEGFSPKTVAVAFDLGHALLVHGDDWSGHFERLRPHVGVVYVKDTDRSAASCASERESLGGRAFLRGYANWATRHPCRCTLNLSGHKQGGAAARVWSWRSGKVRRLCGGGGSTVEKSVAGLGTASGSVLVKATREKRPREGGGHETPSDEMRRSALSHGPVGRAEVRPPEKRGATQSSAAFGMNLALGLPRTVG